MRTDIHDPCIMRSFFAPRGDNIAAEIPNIPVYAMEAYWRSRDKPTVPPVLKFDARWRGVVNNMPRPPYPLDRTPLPIEQEAGWAPETILTIWGREISLAWIWNQHGSTPRLVAIPTTQSQFHGTLRDSSITERSGDTVLQNVNRHSHG